ncbi:titin-like [Penaeus monodon]|uniref:titin-like n=1 Tax=Penaeus monodon TaxID=6687 RepID=UPI0018A72F7C|nr:titin-like [Penaeus monodon]
MQFAATLDQSPDSKENLIVGTGISWKYNYVLENACPATVTFLIVVLSVTAASGQWSYSQTYNQRYHPSYYRNPYYGYRYPTRQPVYRVRNTPTPSEKRHDTGKVLYADVAVSSLSTTDATSVGSMVTTMSPATSTGSLETTMSLVITSPLMTTTASSEITTTTTPIEKPITTITSPDLTDINMNVPSATENVTESTVTPADKGVNQNSSTTPIFQPFTMRPVHFILQHQENEDKLLKNDTLTTSEKQANGHIQEDLQREKTDEMTHLSNVKFSISEPVKVCCDNNDDAMQKSDHTSERVIFWKAKTPVSFKTSPITSTTTKTTKAISQQYQQDTQRKGVQQKLPVKPIETTPINLHQPTSRHPQNGQPQYYNRPHVIQPVSTRPSQTSPQRPPFAYSRPKLPVRIPRPTIRAPSGQLLKQVAGPVLGPAPGATWIPSSDIPNRPAAIHPDSELTWIPANLPARQDNSEALLFVDENQPAKQIHSDKVGTDVKLNVPTPVLESENKEILVLAKDEVKQFVPETIIPSEEQSDVQLVEDALIPRNAGDTIKQPVADVIIGQISKDTSDPVENTPVLPVRIRPPPSPAKPATPARPVQLLSTLSVQPSPLQTPVQPPPLRSPIQRPPQKITTNIKKKSDAPSQGVLPQFNPASGLQFTLIKPSEILDENNNQDISPQFNQEIGTAFAGEIKANRNRSTTAQSVLEDIVQISKPDPFRIISGPSLSNQSSSNNQPPEAELPPSVPENSKNISEEKVESEVKATVIHEETTEMTLPIMNIFDIVPITNSPVETNTLSEITSLPSSVNATIPVLNTTAVIPEVITEAQPSSTTEKSSIHTVTEGNAKPKDTEVVLNKHSNSNITNILAGGFQLTSSDDATEMQKVQNSSKKEVLSLAGPGPMKPIPLDSPQQSVVDEEKDIKPGSFQAVPPLNRKPPIEANEGNTEKKQELPKPTTPQLPVHIRPIPSGAFIPGIGTPHFSPLPPRPQHLPPQPFPKGTQAKAKLKEQMNFSFEDLDSEVPEVNDNSQSSLITLEITEPKPALPQPPELFSPARPTPHPNLQRPEILPLPTRPVTLKPETLPPSVKPESQPPSPAPQTIETQLPPSPIQLRPESQPQRPKTKLPPHLILQRPTPQRPGIAPKFQRPPKNNPELKKTRRVGPKTKNPTTQTRHTTTCFEATVPCKASPGPFFDWFPTKVPLRRPGVSKPQFQPSRPSIPFSQEKPSLQETLKPQLVTDDFRPLTPSPEIPPATENKQPQSNQSIRGDNKKPY